MRALPILDLELLLTFTVVVRTGSFTAAARALHRTQSATSMQMQRLEEQLECKLLIRQRDGCSLTPDGEWLLPRARELLALNEHVFAERKLSPVGGLVRIGAVEHYATAVLPTLLAQFGRKYPHVQFDLQIGLPSTMRTQLGLEYDLIIGMGPEGVAANSKIPGTTVVARTETVWVCAHSYQGWRERPLPLALQPEGSGVRAWAIAALDGTGVPWRESCRCGSLAALENSVRAGLGVAVFTAQTISNRLRVLRARDGFPTLPRAEVWIAKPEAGVSRATNLLHDYVVSEISSRAARTPPGSR